MHIRDLRRIRSMLDSKTASTIATSIVHFQLNYCNSLLIPQSRLRFDNVSSLSKIILHGLLLERPGIIISFPRQQKFRAMNGAHLASPVRGELGYAHWPQLGTQFIALLGTKFGAH